MTDEELDALENNLAVRGKQDREMSNHYVHRMEVDRVAAKSAITTLRAQLAEAREQTALGMVDVMATAAKEAREKALREAVDVIESYDRQDGGAANAILALIEKPNAR